MRVSPFSQTVRYTAPDGKGVYFFPHTVANPAGWGEPRKTDDGKTIKPGTVGGPYPNALIYRDKDTWRASSSKYVQLSGNVTWWGNLIDENNLNKGRHVLSYFGPRLRYFPDASFSYGSAAEHNDIYYRGGYASVAPGPVLGACIRVINAADHTTGAVAPHAFLIVAALLNGEVAFYRKRWDYRRISPDSLSTDARAKEMRLMEPKDNPDGWEYLGGYTRPDATTYYAQKTPWFFNRSGSQAAAIVMRKKEYNNGYETKTEDAFERVTAVVTDTSVSASNIGNETPFAYKEKIFKEVFDYTSTDIEGHTHTWHEDHVRIMASLTGHQYVLCEFFGDDLYWGRIDYNMQRLQEGYYTEGTDPTPYSVTYLGNPLNISNRGLREGPRMLNYYKYGVLDTAYVPSPGDHEFTLWIGSTSEIKLHYGTDANPEEHEILLHSYRTGTKDQWAGDPPSSDLSLYFWQHSTAYFLGMLDLRREVYLAAVHEDHGLWQDPNSTTASHHEEIDCRLSIDGSQTSVFFEKDDNEGPAAFGWAIATIDALPETLDVTLERTSYSGLWPTDNATGTVQAPGNKTFYVAGPIIDLYVPWPSVYELLYGSWLSSTPGNGVITEKNEIGFSVEIPSKDKPATFVVVSSHNLAGDPKTLIGFGDRFHPVGAC